MCWNQLSNQNFAVIPRDVVANVQDCEIKGSEFKL